MSDVFISYSHKDTDFVRDLVKPLEAEGFSVWWDHTIPPGKSWDDVIARGIREAKACVIVWSPDSVISDWVKEEATLAKEGGKYLPIQIGVDQPPMGFRRIQAADLRNWNGNRQNPQWRLLITEIANLVGGSNPPPTAPTPIPTPPERTAVGLRMSHRPAALLSVGALALVAVILAAWWYGRSGSPQREAPAGSADIMPSAPNPAPGDVEPARVADVTPAAPHPGKGRIGHAVAAPRTPTPSNPANGGPDPAIVGVFTLDTVVADFNTHYVNAINADGTYLLTGTQEEDGTNAADSNGNFRNVGLNTGRVHTGTVQIIDNTHFQANTTVYQLTKALLPPGQPNPSLLGTWSGTGNASGQLWTWTWSSTTPGHYHFEGHMSDRGHVNFANGQWTSISSVSAQSGGGTYGIVDAGHILVNGVVWTRQ